MDGARPEARLGQVDAHRVPLAVGLHLYRGGNAARGVLNAARAEEQLGDEGALTGAAGDLVGELQDGVEHGVVLLTQQIVIDAEVSEETEEITEG